MDQGTQQNKPYNKLTVVLSPQKLALILTGVVLCLLLAHVSSHFLKYVLHHDTQLGFARLVDLGTENNIPTWYASSALLLCAGLLAGIGLSKRRGGDRYARHWLALASIFLYLSVDEAASIHEMTGRLLKTRFAFDGYLYYSWVIPFGIFAFIIGLMYLRFVASLPRGTRYQFILAGTLYVGGALGIEMVGANQHSLYGGNTLMGWNLYTLEESLEMFGIVVFIYSLVSYMNVCVKEVTFQIGESVPISHVTWVRKRRSPQGSERHAA